MKLTIFLLLFSQALSAQELAWPEITRTRKPWTRWWWPGSIVTQQDLITAMEKYQKADLGGMEIAVIYGVKGQEDKFINYLSPKWREMFTHTLREGERLNLGIDLAEYFPALFQKDTPEKMQGYSPTIVRQSPISYLKNSPPAGLSGRTGRERLHAIRLTDLQEGWGIFSFALLIY